MDRTLTELKEAKIISQNMCITRFTNGERRLLPGVPPVWTWPCHTSGQGSPQHCRYTFLLKTFGQRTKNELLVIANYSFVIGTLPQNLKQAVIQPLKKADAANWQRDLQRCRNLRKHVLWSAALLSVSRGSLCFEQARLRVSRPCEDQIVWVTQLTS